MGMSKLRNTGCHSVLPCCTTPVSKARALLKEACGLCSLNMFAERALHEQRLRNVGSSEQLRESHVSRCRQKSFGRQSSDASLLFHSAVSGKTIKRAKGPLLLIASPSCAERSLSLGHEVLSVNRPSQNAVTH